jgi:UDPglucose 6-dehydrogenase
VNYKIAITGLWHLGEIYSTGLAELGHGVTIIGADQKTSSAFLSGVAPLPEPDLETLIKKNLSLGRLTCSDQFESIKEHNVLWITLDTPVNNEDEVDLRPIFEALEKSIPYLVDHVLIVVSSQIPVGTSAKVIDLIKVKRPDLIFDYVYAPENLRLGEAVHCFFNPERILAGCSSDQAYLKIQEIFSGLKCEVVKISPASAEMAKHAVNAFLATSVSFINDLANLCEKVDADVLEVTRALRSESRIGPKAFLDAGLGFSGGTLGRDLKSLLLVAQEKSIDLPIVKNVFAQNNSRKNLVAQKLKDILGNLSGKKIAILGLTYKPNTKTLRRSRALEVAKDLIKEGCLVSLSDPLADEAEVLRFIQARFFVDPYKAIESVDVVILITPCPDFKNLDFKKIIDQAAVGVLFFDTANLFWDKVEEMGLIGLKYIGLGRN